MSRIKVLNRDKIEELLKDGNMLSWNSILAQSYIMDKNFQIVGAVRFDTFLKVRKELDLKRTNHDSRELYVIG